jgi:hypothetical protein
MELSRIDIFVLLSHVSNVGELIEDALTEEEFERVLELEDKLIHGAVDYDVQKKQELLKETAIKTVKWVLKQFSE